MIYTLLADSGSTKADWSLMADGTVAAHIRTKGLNPFQMSEDEIANEVKTALLPQLQSACSNEATASKQDLGSRTLNSLHFYGAGCTPEKIPVVERALHRHLHVTGVCEVASDMLGAARALCGDQPGIACILGTGSNSCAYDGEKIVKNVPALGFILGDEGSGAVLGKTLVADILKNQLPQTIIQRFNDKYHLTAADIIDRVYRQPKPNTFLASFVPFLQENIAEPAIYALVKEGFRRFLCRNVKQYDGWNQLPIGFNGSIALIYRQPLEEVMKEEGMKIGKIIQAPIDGLIEQEAAQWNKKH